MTMGKSLESRSRIVLKAFLVACAQTLKFS